MADAQSRRTVCVNAKPTSDRAGWGFPPGFLWGGATSSYQVEGATATEGRGRSIWDDFCEIEGAILDGTSGRDACRHFELWRDDVALMESLRFGAYRFSIAWPRIFPDGDGAVNVAGLGFYDRLVDGLLEAGIEPFVTLYHWDLPAALEANGGWLDRRTAEAFARYAGVVAGRLGDRVTKWTTLNEPYVSANLGYVSGDHAPGRRLSQAKGFDAAHHLMLAHALGMAAVREASSGADVGIALNFTPVTQVGIGPSDSLAATIADAVHNRWFLEPLFGLPYPEVACRDASWSQKVVWQGDMEAIATPIDFLGINYYTRQLVSSTGVLPAPEPMTTMGWEVHSESFTLLLTRLRDLAGEIDWYITENGAAMPDDRVENGIVQDADRIAYLAGHIGAVERAISSGSPIRGYFLWSLLDNFEWSFGFQQKFGIVAIEPETFRRVPKLSADWYRKVIVEMTAARGDADDPLGTLSPQSCI